MQPWNTRDRTTVLSQPPFLVVEQHAVELPDGRIIDDWPWIITPDFINIVVVMEDGRWLFFRQTKYAVDGTSLAPVGGYIDADEEPFHAANGSCARRQAARLLNGCRSVATLWTAIAVRVGHTFFWLAGRVRSSIRMPTIWRNRSYSFSAEMRSRRR